MKNTNILIALIICVLVYTCYTLTQIKSPTPFNYFTLLGESLVHGKIYLTQNPPHLNELISTGDPNKWYVVYPPMPAIMSIPFVLLYGNAVSQTAIAVFFGSLNAGLMYLVGNRLFGKRVGITLSLLLAFGTNHWYLATEGSSWYIAHIFAVFFILLAVLALEIRKYEESIVYSNNSSRWLLAGLFIGAAYWSRLPAILSAPFFLAVLLLSPNKKFIQKLTSQFTLIIAFLSGVAIFILFNFLYNYVRFQSIFDKSYELIPGVLNEPWFDKGIFSLSYLPKNILFFFFKTPLPYEKFPYYKPSMEGMAFLLTSPFFVFLSLIKWKKLVPVAALLTGVFVLAPALTHGTPGFSQFGYRFAMDATPLFLIALGSFLQRKWWWVSIPTIIFAIAINFWGIYFIRTLGITGW